MNAHSAAKQVETEAAPIVACTVASRLDAFAGLIAEMDAALGQGWGELTPEEAELYLQQPDAATLEFVALAVGPEDADRLDLVGRLVGAARARGVAVILVAADVPPSTLHALLKLGAQSFVPYPLPEGEFAAAVSRLPAPGTSGAFAAATGGQGAPGGVVLAVHGLAGGVGATTFAVNLATELARQRSRPTVCLLDFDLQFGSVATFLDMPRREASAELIADASTGDRDGLRQALTEHRDRLEVLTAPPDMLPLDMLTPEGAERVVELATRSFDYVVIDMPMAVTPWTGPMLSAAQLYFAVVALDLRSAENALRFSRAVASEELPAQSIRWVVNRAPGRFDPAGRSRLARFAQGLDVTVEVKLPDGGRAVARACDEGVPLAEAASRNPLRRGIARLAGSLHQRTLAEAAARRTN